MRNEAEMYQIIFETAKKLPQVLAVGMNGSRTNKKAPKDCFQDYDIVYIVEDLKSLLADETWLCNFGPRLIMEKPEAMKLFPPSNSGEFPYLMLFEDGNRIDLRLYPVSEIDTWLKEDQLIEVLYDPENILPVLPPPSDQDHWVKKPDQQEFLDCCNELWWVSTYVVKGVWRKELIYATDHLYEICQKELLRMLSWLAAEPYDYQISTGKNFKYLFDYLPEEKANIEKLFNFETLEKVSRSLLETQLIFHRVAQQYAQIRAFTYDQKTAENVMAYTKKWLQK